MNEHPRQVNDFIKNFRGGTKRLVPAEIATFENRFGETKVIRLTRSGLRVQNNQSTAVLELNRRIAGLLAANIKARRVELGMTLEQVCVASGLVSPTPKSRMWEIENNLAGNGLRLGTVYALAIALQTTPDALLPTLDEVMAGGSVQQVSETRLAVVAP